MAVVNRRESMGKTPTNNSYKFNPFKKSQDSPNSSSVRGFSVLDSLKSTKAKDVPIFRPVMKKPKVRINLI